MGRAPLLAGAALLVTALADPMPAAADPVTIPDSESFEMKAATGRVYRITLARPSREAPPAGYPVLYFLDGDAVFPVAAGVVRFRTRGPKGLEGAAVVGIGYPGDQPFATAERYRDYTTPAAAENLPKRSDGSSLPANGEAEAFLDFVETELKPEIARRLPADPARATLVGHSLGGFLTLHAFLTRPGLFSTWIAGSPSVWWNGEEILARARAYAVGAPARTGEHLFIGVGGHELPDMVAGAEAVYDALAPLAARGLTIDHAEFADEEHTSVIPALVSRAITLSLAPANPELSGGKPPYRR